MRKALDIIIKAETGECQKLRFGNLLAISSREREKERERERLAIGGKRRETNRAMKCHISITLLPLAYFEKLSYVWISGRMLSKIDGVLSQPAFEQSF